MIQNPALTAFITQLDKEVVMAQALVRRKGSGYELLHVADREATAESLRAARPAEGRSLAQFTASGEFRPLKAAPTLQKGWRIQAASNAELELALNGLYPGALADWFSARAPQPPVTNFRAFTERQSGMYRITAKLTDARALRVIGQGCDAAHCLKQRLWTIAGLEPDAAGEKSLIPCLEPCAVLLELARKAARIEQKDACAGAEAE